jgi:hypothetical protein
MGVNAALIASASALGCPASRAEPPRGWRRWRRRSTPSFVAAFAPASWRDLRRTNATVGVVVGAVGNVQQSAVDQFNVVETSSPSASSDLPNQDAADVHGSYTAHAPAEQHPPEEHREGPQVQAQGQGALLSFDDTPVRGNTVPTRSCPQWTDGGGDDGGDDDTFTRKEAAMQSTSPQVRSDGSSRLFFQPGKGCTSAAYAQCKGAPTAHRRQQRHMCPPSLPSSARHQERRSADNAISLRGPSGTQPHQRRSGQRSTMVVGV